MRLKSIRRCCRTVAETSQFVMYARQGFSLVKLHNESFPLFILVLLSSAICSSWIIIEKWPFQGFSNVLPFSRTSPAPRGNCADWWSFKRWYRLYSPFLSRMVFAPPIPTISFPHHRSLSLIHLFSLPNTNHWFFRGSIKYLRCVGRPLSMGIWREKIIFKTKSWKKERKKDKK